MTKLNSDTFSIDVPGQFEIVRVVKETALARTFTTGHTLQPPELQVELTQVQDYDDRQGGSFLERCLDSIHDYGEELELLKRYEMMVNGRPSRVQEGRRTRSRGWRSAVVRYFLGGVQISHDDGYLVRAFCEEGVVQEFRPLFFDVWSSLEWSP